VELDEETSKKVIEAAKSYLRFRKSNPLRAEINKDKELSSGCCNKSFVEVVLFFKNPIFQFAKMVEVVVEEPWIVDDEPDEIAYLVWVCQVCFRAYVFW